MSVGLSLPRIDARTKVTGSAPYPGDLSMPGMAHAKVLFARRPHARVISIDTREAASLPGVLGVFTGADVPNNEYGLMLFDAPVMVGVAGGKVFDGVVRHVGEKMALIVAETERIAERARDLIRIEYEDLPVIDSIEAALAPGGPQIHPHYPGNVIQHYKIRHGDAAAGFARAEVIIEGEYRTGAQEHAYLQPEAGLAYIDEQGRVTVQVAGQWAHEDQEQIAHALRLSIGQVRVIYPAIGGAFGGREDMSVQIVLALAAQRLSRPVKIIWTREESIIGHHKRHPAWAKAKLGALRDGTLVAAQVQLYTDAGPYNYTSNKVLGNATVTCVGPYVIPNVTIDSAAVVTNNVPGGAFRGFGSPQALFIAETQMNKLADALGMDPVALRRKNALRDGSITVNGSVIPDGCSMVEVMDACAAAADWGAAQEAPPVKGHIKRGRGFAAGHKNIGFSFGAPERCEATIELHGATQIERAVVFHAGADCGQGAHTAFLQIAAEALGLPTDKIELCLSDTSTSESSGSASASRLTFMAAGSIVGAAAAALQKWKNEERPARAHFIYRPRATTAMDPETGAADPNITYGYVAEVADVEVDIETGQVRVLKLICADDVGRAVNPQQVVGQIEGGVAQGLGWATLEHFVSKGGRPLTTRFSTYLIPSVYDVPDSVESVLIETPDPHGALGIRGMAEMPLLPVAPAVVAAIHAATGVWMDELPVTAERLRARVRV
ncbi:MAG: xanthine dehydrogenase family protein molybdopterin-binding subunit [Thermoflexales bacterium]